MEQGEQDGETPRQSRPTGPSPGALRAAREKTERAAREAEEQDRRRSQPAPPAQPLAEQQPPVEQQPPPAAPGSWPTWQARPSQPGHQQPSQPSQPAQQQPSQPSYPQPSYPAYQQPPYGHAQPGWGQTPYGYAPVPYGYEQPHQAQRRQAVTAAPHEHPKELPWQLAGWWSRVGAQVIDLLIVWVPLAIVLVLLIIPADSARNGSGTETTLVVIAIVTTFLAWGVHLFYAPLLMKRKGARNGQTLGKQICNIRVIRADGEPMKFADAALRQIIYKSFGMLVASTFVPLFPWILNYLWPTWDDQHRALHDLAADTRVVAA